jgi:hypothetical protein
MKFVSQLLFLAAAGTQAQVCDVPRPDLQPEDMTYAPSTIAEDKSLAAAKPKSAEDLYLYGRVLTGTKTPEAIASLDRALAADEHYTPAFARDYVNKLVPSLSLPTNWIVDTEGVSKLEKLGFGDANGKWIDDTKEKIENVAKTK